MLDNLPVALMLPLIIALPAAPILYALGRRAAACLVFGLALGSVAAGAALAVAVNPDPGLNATGIGLWLLLLALAIFTLHAARRPALQPAALALGGLVSLGLAGGLIYLLVGFKIF